jgi:hypothetical protein
VDAGVLVAHGQALEGAVGLLLRLVDLADEIGEDVLELASFGLAGLLGAAGISEDWDLSCSSWLSSESAEMLSIMASFSFSGATCPCLWFSGRCRKPAS